MSDEMSSYEGVLSQQVFCFEERERERENIIRMSLGLFVATDDIANPQ
jgi:hypothetical protein